MNLVFGQRLKRQRRNKFHRGGCHYDMHVYIAFYKQIRDFSRFVSRNTAGYTQNYLFDDSRILS